MSGWAITPRVCLNVQITVCVCTGITMYSGGTYPCASVALNFNHHSHGIQCFIILITLVGNSSLPRLFPVSCWCKRTPQQGLKRDQLSIRVCSWHVMNWWICILIKCAYLNFVLQRQKFKSDRAQSGTQLIIEMIGASSFLIPEYLPTPAIESCKWSNDSLPAKPHCQNVPIPCTARNKSPPVPHLTAKPKQIWSGFTKSY